MRMTVLLACVQSAPPHECHDHRGQKTVWVPWNWSHRWLSATTWVLGREHRSSVSTANVPNH